jgi:hypothetical protein
LPLTALAASTIDPAATCFVDQYLPNISAASAAATKAKPAPRKSQLNFFVGFAWTVPPASTFADGGARSGS